MPCAWTRFWQFARNLAQVPDQLSAPWWHLAQVPVHLSAHKWNSAQVPPRGRQLDRNLGQVPPRGRQLDRNSAQVPPMSHQLVPSSRHWVADSGKKLRKCVRSDSQLQCGKPSASVSVNRVGNHHWKINNLKVWLGSGCQGGWMEVQPPKNDTCGI